MSFVTPRSSELVQIIHRADMAAGENGGVALYGADLSKWPAWAVDALVVIEQERIRADNARAEAERPNR